LGDVSAMNPTLGAILLGFLSLPLVFQVKFIISFGPVLKMSNNPSLEAHSF
jgi:hypothetical protein